MKLLPCCVTSGASVSSPVGDESAETPRQMPYCSKWDCDDCLKKIKDYVIVAVKVCAIIVGSIVAFCAGAVFGVVRYTAEFMINRSKHYDKHHSPEEINKRDRFRCVEINYYKKMKAVAENARLDVLGPLTSKEIEELEAETSYEELSDALDDIPTYLDRQLQRIRRISNNRLTRTIDEKVMGKYEEAVRNLGSLESIAEGEKVGVYEFERKLNDLVRWSGTRHVNIDLSLLLKQCDCNIAAIQHVRDKHPCAACCHFCNHPIVEKIPNPIRGFGFGIVAFIPCLLPCGFFWGGVNSVRMWVAYVWGCEPPENKFPWRSRYPFGDGNTL
ncbi:hypothetical protein [Kistimonas asteriae]|uniref:hypothetical protein n=1 Tax=Kistimonas asteriae TaxID=517724 RepID=UPI001BA461E3|nr:hypothetical protein [Kistimonas asteriae]